MLTNKAHLVKSQTKIYPDIISVYIPKTPIIRNGVQFDTVSQNKHESRDKETNLERSLRRTNSNISNILLCNTFRYFATFTFNPDKSDRTNIPLIKTKMRNWLKNTQKYYGTFNYLLVAELHKDGSVHFHGVFSDLPCKLTPARSQRTNRLIKRHDRQVYNIGSFTLGFTTAIPIDQNPESRQRLAVYLKKYLSKDLIVLSGKKRYWVSHGLKHPIQRDDETAWFEDLVPNWQTEIENGVLMRFERGNSAKVDSILEQYKEVWHD